jgi:hypothetical protein
MVLTRRNRAQLNIQPTNNEADLFRLVRRVLPIIQNSPQITQPSPANSSVSQQSLGSLRSIDLNDAMDWYSDMGSPQQDRFRQWIKRYRPRDTAHRHRLNDSQPKQEVVRTYTRRKA